MLGGEGLEPSKTAKTVRVREGERLVTDGPFAETKEQVSGFYLFDCSDLSRASRREWCRSISASSPSASLSSGISATSTPGESDRLLAEDVIALEVAGAREFLDEAIEWAAKVPVPDGEPVEIRPVMDYSGTS